LLDGVLALVGAHVALLVEPARQLLGHRPGRAQELLGGPDLSDHEVAEELTEVADDVLGAEEVAEGVLVASVKGLLPAPVVGLVEAVGAVAVERVAEQVDDVVVVAHGARREAPSLVGQEGVERLVDGQRFGHPLMVP